MSLTSHNLLTNSPSRISFYTPKSHSHLLKNPNNNSSLSFTNPPHFPLLKTQPPIRNISRSSNAPLGLFESDPTEQKRDQFDSLNLDAFLSLAEFMCLASSVVVAIGFVVNSAFSRPIFVWVGNGVSVWQLALVVGGLVMGVVIRWRQWRKICKDFSKVGGSGVNLVGRIEKLEEDLRSSATIIRVLSRQLEKLGIRFRVTRKALKEPIGETAALAQKNSEATRALAAQEDLLEKELGEIQKVLLAMQEQQEKQLDLILAIVKTGKLWEDNSRGDPSNSPMDGVKPKVPKQVQTSARKEEGNNRWGDPSNSPMDGVKPKAPKQVQTSARKEEGNNDFGIGI